jgi:hypothetical protein
MWQIENKADFEKAMAALDEAKFIAEMSDDFSCWRREREEVDRQRRQVLAAAREKGLI